MSEKFNDESVARLIRLAGQRPTVPEADAAMVKAAARAQWQWTVASERRRGRFVRGAGALLAAAAAIVAIVGSGLWQSWSRSFTDPIAVMARSVAGGEAEELWPGDVLETEAEAVAVRMSAAAESVRLDAGSRIRFRSRSTLELERGAVYIDSAQPGSTLEVRTDFGSVRHLGTQFEVRLETAGETDVLRVRVREGRVEVEDRRGRRQVVTKGQGLAVTRTESISQEVPCHGAAWDWVTAARPPFETRQRSVLEVLEWAAREGCWKLRFADAEDRQRVAAVDVGSANLPDGRLEDALDAMLLGSSLGLRLDREPLSDGVLQIERR